MAPTTTMTRSALLLFLGALPTWSCTENTMEPEPGAVLLAARTSGGDEDVDGYTVSVDGGSPLQLPPDGQLTVPNLAPGLHRAQLDGIAPNCDAVPGTTQEFQISPGETELVLFSVACLASGLLIRTSVEGVDDPHFYTVSLDGAPRPEQIARNGSKTIEGIAPGLREVSLGNLPSNCSLTPGVHKVTVTLRVITPVDFIIRCVATAGAVEVKVETSGEDVDLGGYIALVTQTLAVHVGANGVGLRGDVPPGAWEVRLTGIAPNCETVGGDLRGVAVRAGGLTRDTTRVSFAVSCWRMWHLAFERQGKVALATEDGALIDLGPDGSGPSWSPDGLLLAFAVSCGGICVFNLDRGVQSTTGWPDQVRGISWNPDGSRLVFASERCFADYYWYYEETCTLDALYTTRPNGTGTFRIELPRSVTRGSDPAWSPDGSTIAFGCALAGVEVRKLCAVSPNGTGFRELTATGGEDSRPSWSPDGARLVFATTRFGPVELATIKPDGTDLRRMEPPLRGASPAWARDGRILFSATGGLARVNADGSGFILLTHDADTHPTPRPPR